MQKDKPASTSWNMGLGNANKTRTGETTKDHDSTVRHTDEASDDCDPGIYHALRPTLLFGMVFGLVPLSNATQRTSTHLAFRWLSPQTIYSTVILVNVMFTAALCDAYFFLSTSETSTFSDMAMRLGAPLFYTSACLSLTFMLNAARKIPNLFQEWDLVALRLVKYIHFPKSDSYRRKRVNSVFSFVQRDKLWCHRISVTKATVIAVCFMSSATIEHTLHDLSFFANHPCVNVTSFIECHLAQNSDFLSGTLGDNPVAMVAVYVLNKYANVAWNFHDLFVIQLSFALSTNFKVISEHMKNSARLLKSPIEWRHLREDHLALCEMVSKVDSVVAPIILLSYVVNVYFVANQIFLGVRPTKGDLLETFYVLASFGHLVGRLCLVSFSASHLYDQAREPLNYLYKCPAISYNHEVHRFANHITFNTVGFTGCKFFVINRSFFLAIVSLIFTYELLLLDVS